MRSLGAMVGGGAAVLRDEVSEAGVRLTEVGDTGAADTNAELPALYLAFVFRSLQQRPQRHSACQLPSGR
jgi:hypothetical protein